MKNEDYDNNNYEDCFVIIIRTLFYTDLEAPYPYKTLKYLIIILTNKKTYPESQRGTPYPCL